MVLLCVAFAALLVVPTVPVAPGTHPAAAVAALGTSAASLALSGGPPAALPSPAGTGVAPSLMPNPRTALGAPPGAFGLPCPAAVAGWISLYDRGLLPPTVRGSDTPNCVPGADDAGVSFVSAQPLSGSRPEFRVSLPNISSYDAGSLAAFWIGMEVAGPPCSLDGQSVLRIEFIPPTDPYGLGPSSYWQVRAPIWDLVSPGACDPQCQNASALFTIGGARFCEDDAVIAGLNARAGAAVALLESGDALRLEVGAGGAAPLTVYLNDSTHPPDSAAWQYPASDLVGGAPAEAFRSTAAATAGWTFGGSVSVGWTSCPVENASVGVPCNSYSGGPMGALSYPRVTNSSFWDPGRHAFDGQYGSFESWSSSGACSGAPGVSPCTNFHGFGGAGVYPSLSYYASAGAASIGYGPNASGLVRAVANASHGFLPDGSATLLNPPVITQLNAVVTPNEINLSARATDPRGIFEVLFGALFCFNGPSTVPVYYEFTAFEGPGPLNGSEDGTFNYTGIPRGSTQTGGTLYYWARVDASASGPTGPPVLAQQRVVGSPSTCQRSVPSPAVGVSGFPVSSGFRVSWGYPTATAGEVRNYSIIATPVGGGASTVIPIPNRDARSATVLLRPNANYSLALGVTSLDGGLTRVPVALSSPTTLLPLTASYSVAGPELWQPGALGNVSVRVAGGQGPYCAFIGWGDGQVVPACGGTLLQALHPYGAFFGSARVEVTVNDSLGDATGTNASMLSIRATPLGVHVTVYAGDGVVNVNWTAPMSPAGPVTRYVVYFTSDPGASSDLTAAWPDNVSGPHPVFLRNTTLTRLDDFAVPDSATFYVEVVAWDSYGAGLVGASGPAVGRPAPLSVEFNPPPSGGSAPYTTSLYAIVTSGSPNALTSAVFFSGTSPGVSASVSTVGGTSWVNGSFTFPTPGLTRISVHIIDALSEADAATVSLYIGPGAAPVALVNVLTLTPYVGRPVGFEATISFGTGPYNYSWDFGDGAFAADTVARPSHTYAEPGEYTVSVTVADNGTGAESTVARPFVVYAPPSVAISASTGSSGGLSFSFHAVVYGGSGPVTVAWAFGDGSGASNLSASHVYATVGVYTVSVTVTDPTGLHASASVPVYAGVARTTVPFLGGPNGVTLLILLVAGLIVLGGAAAYFYGKARATRVLEGERMEETEEEPVRRLPPPSEGAPTPAPEGPKGPAS